MRVETGGDRCAFERSSPSRRGFHQTCAVRDLLRPRAAAVVACALAAVILAGVAGAATPETELAAKFAPVVRLVEQKKPCGHGEPYEPTDVDVALRERRRRPSRPVGRSQRRQDRARGRRSQRRAGSTTTSTFPGDALDPGVHLRAVVEADHEGHEPDRLRARGLADKALPRQAGPPVLVLLRLQPLQQPPRRRLGDDPAQLRRVVRRGGAVEDADGDRY